MNIHAIIVHIDYYKSNLFGSLILCLGLWLIFMLWLLSRLCSLFTHWLLSRLCSLSFYIVLEALFSALEYKVLNVLAFFYKQHCLSFWWGMISSLVIVGYQLLDTIFCHLVPCTWHSDQWVCHVWVRITTYPLHWEFQLLVRVHGWYPFALLQHVTMVGQCELVCLVKSALVTAQFHWGVHFYKP